MFWLSALIIDHVVPKRAAKSGEQCNEAVFNPLEVIIGNRVKIHNLPRAECVEVPQCFAYVSE
jgi:hypothetical protein